MLFVHYAPFVKEHGKAPGLTGYAMEKITATIPHLKTIMIEVRNVTKRMGVIRSTLNDCTIVDIVSIITAVLETPALARRLRFGLDLSTERPTEFNQTAFCKEFVSLAMWDASFVLQSGLRIYHGDFVTVRGAGIYRVEELAYREANWMNVRNVMRKWDDISKILKKAADKHAAERREAARKREAALKQEAESKQEAARRTRQGVPNEEKKGCGRGRRSRRARVIEEESDEDDDDDGDRESDDEDEYPCIDDPDAVTKYMEDQFGDLASCGSKKKFKRAMAHVRGCMRAAETLQWPHLTVRLRRFGHTVDDGVLNIRSTDEVSVVPAQDITGRVPILYAETFDRHEGNALFFCCDEVRFCNNAT